MPGGRRSSSSAWRMSWVMWMKQVRLRGDLRGGGDRLVGGEVRRMPAIAKEVQDERPQSSQEGPRLRRNRRAVGAVGERQRTGLLGKHLAAAVDRLDAEAEDRQAPVQERHRRELQPVEQERAILVDRPRDQVRDERVVDVRGALEDVAIDPAQAVERARATPTPRSAPPSARCSAAPRRAPRRGRRGRG